jgi:hypothetical protein
MPFMNMEKYFLFFKKQGSCTIKEFKHKEPKFTLLGLTKKPLHWSDCFTLCFIIFSKMNPEK